MKKSEKNKNYKFIVDMNIIGNVTCNLTAMERLIYIVVCGLAHSEGYCYASNQTIANMVDSTKDSVSKAVSRLNSQKIIKCEFKKNEKNQIIERKIYILDPSSDAELTDTDEETEEEKESKKIENKQLKTEFDTFWAIYPKKINMDTAYNSYRNWRRGRMYAGEMRQMSYDEIMMVTNLYIEQWTNEHTDPQYIPEPAKFLNSRVYENLINLKKKGEF